MAPRDDLINAKALLLDIEGTTTSIDFVKKQLFPYARQNLSQYLKNNWGKDPLQSDIKLLKEQSDRDKLETLEGLVEIKDGDDEIDSIAKNVEWQMDNDRKSTALKQLQGHIWEEGYKTGDLKGHLYDDVAQCLRRWSDDGHRLFIYSSGSIEAQKLLFGNSTAGDLLDIIAGHFDTTTGPKTESKSYAAIAAAIDCPADQILFLTDVPKEAEAAKTAGLQTVIVVREGNAPLTEEEAQTYSTIKSFEDLVLERCSKRQKTDTKEVSEVVVPAPKTEETKEEMEVDVTSTEKTEPESKTETPTEVEPEKKVEETETAPKTEEPKKEEAVPAEEIKEKMEVDEKIEVPKEEEKTVEIDSSSTKEDVTETKDTPKEVTTCTETSEKETSEAEEKKSEESKEEPSEKVEKVSEGKVETSEEVAKVSEGKKSEEVEKVSEGKTSEEVEKVSEGKPSEEVEKVSEGKVETSEEVEKVSEGKVETSEEVEKVSEAKVETSEKVAEEPPKVNGVNGNSDKPAENGVKTNGVDKTAEPDSSSVEEKEVPVKKPVEVTEPTPAEVPVTAE